MNKESYQEMWLGTAMGCVEWWRNQYKKVFMIGEPDFRGLVVPRMVVDFDFPVITPRNITLNRVAEVYRDLHGLQMDEAQFAHPPKKGKEEQTFPNLDSFFTINERNWKDRAQAIWIRARQDADVELQGISVNELRERQIPGMMPIERLLAGHAFKVLTGEHMDRETKTVCTGSTDDVHREYAVIYFDYVPKVTRIVRVLPIYPKKAFARKAVSQIRSRQVILPFSESFDPAWKTAA